MVHTDWRKERDIRLCGDCINSIENPLWDSNGINRLLLCKIKLEAVTFSQSVRFCKDYRVEEEKMSIYECKECKEPYGCEVSTKAPVRLCQDCKNKCVYFKTYYQNKKHLYIDDTGICPKCEVKHGNEKAEETAEEKE